jgi:hypothetical protein
MGRVDRFKKHQQLVHFSFHFTVFNQAFDADCRVRPNLSNYWSGTGQLGAGEILRIHAGHRIGSTAMASEDFNGAHHHVFVEQSRFFLNNRCGDEISIWTKDSLGQWVKLDAAEYSANPPEGSTLMRVGSRLVPAVVSMFSNR